MGTCGSRLQQQQQQEKQQGELAARTTSTTRRSGGPRWRQRWHIKQTTKYSSSKSNKSSECASSGSGGSGLKTTTSSSASTSTTTAPGICRSTKVDGASTIATTSTSTSPKPSQQQAPQQAASPSVQRITLTNNGLDFVVPIELVRASIFPLLGAACLERAGCACRSWREASVDENLWKALCLKRWVGKHVALLEDERRRDDDDDDDDDDEQQQEEGGSALPPLSSSSLGSGSIGEEQEHLRRQRQRRRGRRRRAIERAGRLRGGLEELVAAMPIKVMKRRLEELGANPSRLATCLEKDECVSLMLGSMLLSREGLLREKGQMPPWISHLRGWRWSYYFANKDARRSWLTMDDIARTRWTMSFPANMPLAPLTPPPPLPTVACEFHRDFSYTDEGFHPDGLDWHFEDGRRCVKVSHYPALEAERDASWGWRLVNPYVIFEQQRVEP
eukprot:g18473.t2